MAYLVSIDRLLKRLPLLNFQMRSSRVEPAGGRIVEGKTSMGGAGFYALVKDAKGNVFALYSFK